MANRHEWGVFAVNDNGFHVNLTGKTYNRARAREVAHEAQNLFQSGNKKLSYLKNYRHVEVHQVSMTGERFGIPDTCLVIHLNRRKKSSKRG